MQSSPIRRTVPRVLRALMGAALLATLPTVVAAHPLGNFTINHYAEVRVEPDRILLDIVIDRAEIPAFQERRTIDVDGDGVVSDAETATGRLAACATLGGQLDLRVDGERLSPRGTAAGLTFPPGVGGLDTMRLVCGFEAALPSAIGAAAVEIAFADRSSVDRIGWREIVTTGSGVALERLGDPLRTTGLSARLTSYPDDRLATPLDERSVTFQASAGGPVLPPFTIADADPIDESSRPTSDPAAVPDAAPVAATIPGGIEAGELPAIFRATDLTPLVLLVSLLTAAVLGAGHALTPGHGKTLMAAYLVGTRGTPVHALGLGLSVSLSHTLGILLLAALVTGAAGVLPPEVLLRVAPLVAAVSILAIGAWMLATELRRRRGGTPTDHGHGHGHDHGQDHGHGLGEDHGHGHDHGQDHDHHHGASLTWRSLFALGLAGGLIPSTSALLILLGSIAAGRPAFGLVLVIAFGLGMAAVMTTIGVVLVVARGRIDRLPSGGGLGRLGRAVPLIAAGVVLAFGVALTIQALGGTLAL